MNSELFLSVVVPCYNSSKYLPKLLKSVQDCKMDDIEVILVDDCSEDSYFSLISQFPDLFIRSYTTSYRCGSPSNSRELGAQMASGKYLTFVDHDDCLIPEGIQSLRSYIEQNDYPEYLVGGIRQVTLDGEVEIEKFNILPFLHGKFFNREKFYLLADLHHKKDIIYSEDNYFTALTACNLIKFHIAPSFLNFCTNCWTDNPESLSQHLVAEKETNKDLNLKIFRTNISIAYEVYFKFFDEGSLPMEVAREWFIRDIVSGYFDSQKYHQFFKYYVPEYAKMFNEIRKRLKMTDNEVLEFILANDGRLLRDCYEEFIQFWPEETWKSHLKLEEFLDLCK